jgi:hypothetical protein
MLPSFSRKITEWFVVLFVTSLLIWFVLTEPVLPSFKSSQFKTASVTNLQQHVLSLTNTPRMAEFDNLRPPARYIHKQLAEYGKTRYQPFKTAIGVVNNVIAEFGPDTKNLLIIGAHYDSLDGMPGADGNASGVAGLIELARLLSEQKDLPIRVQLAAYALAEGQYFGTKDMGSFRHAQQLKQQQKHVVLMMSLDSIGYFTDKSESQNYPYEFMKLFYPSSGDYIRITGRLQDILAVRKIKKSFTKTSLAVRSLNAPEIIDLVATSDNTSYWEQGFPAVLISDTAADRNPVYHTEKDIAEYLDYERMAVVIQGVGQAVMDITSYYKQPNIVVAQQAAEENTPH